MGQNYSNTQVYKYYNGYHSYSAQLLLALQITLGHASMVVKTEISNSY